MPTSFPIRHRQLIRTTLLLGVLVAMPALAGPGCFLRLDGVQGGSTSVTHVGWSDCESLRFGATLPTVSSGGGSGAGKPNWRSLDLTLRSDRAEVSMLDVLLTGKHLATATVVLEEALGNAQRVLQTLNLKGVRITSLTEASELAGGLPRLALTLEFDQVQLQTPVYNSAGSVVSTESLTFNVLSNQVTQP